MLGDISWAIVCFGVGWFCRGKFGSLGELWAAGKRMVDKAKS